MATAKGTPEVAKAIVTIIPSMEGSRTKISDMIVPSADKAGKEAGSSIGGKISEGLSTAKLAIGNALGNIITSAVSNVSGTIKDTLKDAFDGFGDRQQLWGGVETMFKDSADIVAANAKKAFRTAGVSANQYMETVTGFSASLIQSLGGDTEKAARIADMALTDMSDNANKMGTDLSSLEWAYQGFAKGNMTMLDNLKLGYGGTKSEMQRLLKDATELTKAQGNYREFSLDSYADIIEAIHLVQENIGITGTTTKEAATTIQGSMGMAKAAWQDWLTGLADPNANMKELSSNLVESLKTALKNILPTVSDIGAGIGEGLSNALGEAGFTGAADFVSNLGSTIETAKTNIGTIFDQIVNNNDVQHSVEKIKTILGEIGEKFGGFFERLFGKAPTIEEISDAIVGFVSGALETLGNALEWVNENLGPFLGGLEEFIGEVGKVIGAIVSFFTETEEGRGLLEEVTGFIKDVVVGAFELLGFAIYGIKVAWAELKDFFENDPLGQKIVSIVMGVVSFITGALHELRGVFKIVVGLIKGIVTGDFSEMEEGVKMAMEGSKQATSSALSVIDNIFQTIVGGIKRWFEIQLDLGARAFANVWNWLADQIEQAPGKIVEFFSTLPENLENIFQQAADGAANFILSIPDMIASIPQKIVDIFAEIPSKITGIFESIKLPQFHAIGGFSFEDGNIKLPRLEVYASGGIVTKPTNALLGEAGYPEAVLPLTSRYLTPLLEAADVQGGGGDTYNVINGLEIAPDDYIQEVMVEFFQFLQRKAAMQRG